MTRLLAAALAFSALGTVAQAGTIEKACMQSDRGGDRALCGCIQQVADMTLGAADQRRAAGFFADPDKAQATRQSKTNRDNDFWARYKNFGETAASVCSG